jgi:hypothetical protein
MLIEDYVEQAHFSRCWRAATRWALTQDLLSMRKRSLDHQLPMAIDISGEPLVGVLTRRWLSCHYFTLFQTFVF